MKVFRFKEFCSIDIMTSEYIDGFISEQEFRDYVNLEIFNESISDFYNHVKEKILNVLYTFLVKATQIGFLIIEKFGEFIYWLINNIQRFKEKHPVLYKVILFTVLTIIILLLTTSSVLAQIKEQPVPENQINVAIGWLELLKGKTEIDVIEVNKAIAHLIDLRDGTIDINELGEKSIQIAESALKASEDMIQDAKSSLEKGDDSMAKMCLDLMKRGTEYVDAFYKKVQDTETVKLTMK